ncbi:MAG: class I SAM-dependent methyltransferase [Chitinophagaceae bacterium]
MAIDKCKICEANSNNLIIRAEDVETHHLFNYHNCINCGVVYLKEIPENYQQYYGNNYYSFNASNGIAQQIKYKRDIAGFTGKGILGKILAFLQPNHNLLALKNLSLKPTDSLLDVGCGVGNEISVLKSLGYNKVFGVDPYINEDIYLNKELLVKKQEVFDVNTSFNFITMHHSFEHVFEPFRVLEKLKTLLSQDGKIMIRIPVAQSFAFEKYGKSWVQFDAPRHVFLHTEKSIAHLCSKLGLRVDDVIYDSTTFQFWGSEIVKNGQNIHTALKKTIFLSRLKSFIKGYHAVTKKLNQQKKGDQAIFIISKN